MSEHNGTDRQGYYRDEIRRARDDSRRARFRVEELEQAAKREGFDIPDPAGHDQTITAVPIGKLIRSYPDLRPVVIDGILRRGETANCIAAAKEGKSHLVGGLVWSVATGTPWLGHHVAEGRVLVLDNELHPETLAYRLGRIASEMMIDVDDFADAVDVVPMRGVGSSIHELEARLKKIEPRQYTLAVLDALYRTLPSGTSENDNAAMMAIYNRLDYYAAAWDTAIMVVHHASKGNQGEKSLTDVGAGAGSISRAADTHLVIRPHEEDGLSVLECVTRSFKSPDPVSVKFEWPLWSTVGAEPEVRRPNRQSAEKQAKQDREDAAAMLEQIPVEPKSIQQNKLFERFEFGVNKVKRLAGLLVREKKVKIVRKRKRGGKQTSVFYSQVVGGANSSSDSDSDSDSGF